MKIAVLLAPLVAVSATVLADSTNHSGHTQSTHSQKPGAAKIGSVSIKNAWMRQSPPASKVVGGYAVITNNGQNSDRLIGGKASFAKKIEVHNMTMTNGVMKMYPVEGGLEIAPGATVELKPGSYHLMFLGAVSPMAGDVVPVMLTFENAGDVMIMLPVSKVGAKSSPHDHGN